jgi:hypothetical protein
MGKDYENSWVSDHNDARGQTVNLGDTSVEMSALHRIFYINISSLSPEKKSVKSQVLS